MTNYVNVSQRVPCLLVLDASGSMEAVDPNTGHSRISLLNEGIATFATALREDEMALARVQVAAVNVGGFSEQPQLFLDWTDANDFQPFPMTAGYNTQLGAAVLIGLDVVEAQKADLKTHGISYYRPLMIILTDGAPTDADATWREACRRVREAEAARKVVIYSVGVGGADLAKLSELSTVPPKEMSGLRFSEFFRWLSDSLGQISRSVAGGRVDFPKTDDWSGVQL